MRFQGRYRAEGGRTGLVRRARRSVRLVPQALSSGSSAVESLESRLLLSVYSSGSGPAISFEPLLVNRAFILPVVNTAATLSVHAIDSAPPPPGSSQPWDQSIVSLGGGNAGQMAGGAGPADQRAGDASAAGPMLMFMRTVSQVGLSTSGMLVVTTTKTGSLGEDSVPPVVVMSPSSMLPPSSFPQSGWRSSRSLMGSTTSTGWSQSTGTVGESTVAGASSAPATRASMSVAVLPDAPNVQYDSTWNGPPGTTAVQLPVGPMTHEVGVTIRPGPDTMAADSPILAGLTLIDKDGDTLASIAPIWNPLTNSPANAITVTLNGAPVGGTLIVQLASASEGSVAGSPATNSPGGIAVPFTMDVQRIDALANNGNGVGLGAASDPQSGFLGSSFGTLQWMTNQPNVQNSSVSSSSSQNSSPPTNPSFVTDPTLETAMADEPSTSTALVTSADLGGRIPLGPLASRSAAPMGPNLLSAWLDVTPAVDRHERGVSQAIDDRLSDDDMAEDDIADLSTFGGVLLASTGDRTRPVDKPDGEPGDASTRLGPMPLRTADTVALAPGAADLDDLLAALAITTRHERPPFAGSDDTGSVFSLLDTARHDADARPAPDYLTTAFVLALGMGLTTGPILPDLMRLIPKRGGRRGFVPAGAARSFARPQNRPRLFGDGLWRPVALASRQED